MIGEAKGFRWRAADRFVPAFPKDLSKESVEDLAEYLETFMKRLRRETKTDEAAN